jgi:beta-glucuronidase
MLKSFPRHEARQVDCLDGLWEFAFLGSCDVEEIWLDEIAWNDRMMVPAAFDAMPSYAGKRGVAAYRLRFFAACETALSLHFEAVSLWCRVFVDGQALRDHACGTTGFWCDVPPSPSTKRELVVLVDNRFDFERVPLHEAFFDFYQWGGIIRSVWCHKVPETFLETVQVRVEDYQNGALTAHIRLGGKVPETIELRTRIDGEDEQNHSARVSPEGCLEVSLQVQDPRRWSPARPQLHHLCVQMGADDMTVRFGLRQVKAQNGEILLNGEAVKLRGYNRHESHPQFGPALPAAQLLADLQLLRDLGCNFIRGSHYPQDQRFLDLCDEMGFLVWEECIGWGQRERQLTDAGFIAAHGAAVEEMVKASFNHPSIICWGFLNEAGTDSEYARPIMEATAAQLRRLDPTRLITYATMFGKTDLFLELADIISINIYPGWYGCQDAEDPLGLVVPSIRSFLDHFDARGWAEKPILISEIGAEGLYGWHDALNGFFTEEYQAELLRLTCEEVISNPRLAGVALWHFSDARTYTGGYALGRPRAFNNKGTLDEYRRPKLAYKAVQRVFKSVS